MSRADGRLAGLLAGALTMAATAAAGAEIGGAALLPVSFAELPGWTNDDHAAAFGAFKTSCGALLAAQAPLRPASSADPGLLPICTEALEAGKESAEARKFFEARFQAFEVRPTSGRGFLTGYYEPE